MKFTFEATPAELNAEYTRQVFVDLLGIAPQTIEAPPVESVPPNAEMLLLLREKNTRIAELEEQIERERGEAPKRPAYEEAADRPEWVKETLRLVAGPLTTEINRYGYTAGSTPKAVEAAIEILKRDGAPRVVVPEWVNSIEADVETTLDECTVSRVGKVHPVVEALMQLRRLHKLIQDMRATFEAAQIAVGTDRGPDDFAFDENASDISVLTECIRVANHVLREAEKEREEQAERDDNAADKFNPERACTRSRICASYDGHDGDCIN